MWTTIIALVRLVILLAIRVGSMFHVSGWQSTTIGMAPARTMAAAQEMIVKVGRMTSSPGPMRNAASATSMATLPLHTATPCAQPISCATPASSLLTNGPSDEIQPVSMHSARYCFSLPSRSGRFTGIIVLIEFELLRQHCGKSSFVRVAGVRTLLHLHHVKLLQDLETVAPRDQQDHVSRTKH